MPVAATPAPAQIAPDAQQPPATQEEAARYADLLVGEVPNGTEGDMTRPKSGANLGQQSGHSQQGKITYKAQKALDHTSLTADQVLAKIRNAYGFGMKNCYRNTVLRSDAIEQAGHVELAITVNDTGRSTSVKASAFNEDLATCIQGQMTHWRFPIPKDSSGEPTEAHFELTIRLDP